MIEPIRFFHSSEEQFTPQDIRNMVAKYGNNILVGGDEGWEEDFLDLVKTVKEVEAKLHVYTVGPGMWEWSAEERSQIKNMARKHGIDTKNKNWFQIWKSGVWKKEVFANFVKYKEAYSIEVDNLDSIFSEPQEWIDFYIELQDFRKANNIQTRILIKNIDEETIKLLTKNINQGIIDHKMFAVFAIFERGTGSPKHQTSLMKEIGITAVTPKNGLLPTHKYGTIKKGIAGVVY